MKEKSYRDSLIKQVASGETSVNEAAQKLGLSDYQLESLVHSWTTENSIQPGKGFGQIRLGMAPREIHAIFGGELVYEDWMGGNLNDSLYFHGLILHFDKCDGHGPAGDSKLEMIEIYVADWRYYRNDVFLFSRPLHEWTREAILDVTGKRNLSVKSGSDWVEISPGLYLTFNDDGRLLRVVI